MQQFKVPVFLIAGLFSLPSFAQQTKIDVQTGQKYQVETTTKLNTSADVMGQTMENNTDTKSTTLYEIAGAGQDGISLKSTITKMQVEASMMGQTMSYDSDKKDNEGPIADVLSKMVNKPKGIILDTKGTIVKQDKPEDDGQAAMMGAGATGNETATELFIPALIGKDLKPGDSFTDIGSVKKEKYESKDSGTYSVTAVENGVASVSYTGTQFVSQVMEQMGMEMTSTGNNIVKSELQMDIKTGLILAKATVIESSVSIDAGGMTIPATGKTITTVKISPAM
jgi:Family of unknown function (DUF6263)